jgi:hypothetical protein
MRDRERRTAGLIRGFEEDLAARDLTEEFIVHALHQHFKIFGRFPPESPQFNDSGTYTLITDEYFQMKNRGIVTFAGIVTYLAAYNDPLFYRMFLVLDIVDRIIQH